TITSIEDRYYDGERIPLGSSNRSTCVPDSLRADIEKNLDIIKRKTKEFNNSSSGVGKLGANHLDKPILIEGVKAKYTTEPNYLSSSLDSSSSSLTPTNPTSANKLSYPSPINIVDVTSLATQISPQSRSNQKKVDRDLPTGVLRNRLESNSPDDDESFVKNKKGVLPRSIGRTFNRIAEELNPDSEEKVVGKFRRSRVQTIISLRFLALLIIIPIVSQSIAKNFAIMPLVEQARGNEAAIFINAEMKEEALNELRDYEEELKLEHLIHKAPPIAPEIREEKVREKADELATEFRHKSNSAISNVFADAIALFAFAVVLVVRRQDISVIKTFMDRIIYGLSDSAKAFIIILVTDIFVGFHSPHGWEVLLEGMSSHLGIAANHSAISLFIATVPVIMDTFLKYWLFRYLSQMSPSTLATVKGMNE
ncbi:MAG: proton extrusion protein PcxA, partial [Xenococcaceae cyanobacterium]